MGFCTWPGGEFFVRGGCLAEWRPLVIEGTGLPGLLLGAGLVLLIVVRRRQQRDERARA
jgi:hypothetical protein